MALLVLLGAMAAAAAGYLYVGAKAFRMELGDFQPTPDVDGALPASSMRKAAAVAGWSLSDGSHQRAFYRPSENGASIIYLHGAPGAAIGFHSMVSGLAEYGFGALALDLPGYGASEGQRTWNERYDETLTRAIDFLAAQPDVDPARVGALGYSMGAYVAARAAATDDRVAALALMAGFTDLQSQLMHQFRRRVPGVGWFAIAAARWSGVPVFRMSTVDALAEMAPRPVLVVSGTEDHAIPVVMAENLATVAGDQATLWLVPDAGHVDLEGKLASDSYRRLAEFWAAALRVSPTFPTEAD